MLSTTIDQNRLQLTADLRAVDGIPSRTLPKKPAQVFASEIRRFPPVEDVVATLDRIAKRAFVA